MKHRRWIALSALIVVALIIGLALELDTSTPRGNASTVGSNGLRLSVSINETQIMVGQDLQVNASLFNTLPKVNSVATSNDWLFQGIPLDLWPACDVTLIFGHDAAYTAPAEAVILKGDYTSANISAAANIRFSFLCTEATIVDHVVFQPSSSQANLTGTNVLGENQTLGPFRVSAVFSTRGYWDLLNNSQQVATPIISEPQYPPASPTATAFVPGVYTVAVADQWGQAVILHFVVRAEG